MGNKRYVLDKTIKLNLELDVNIYSINDSSVLSEERQSDILEDIRYEIGAHLSNKFSDSYSQEEVVPSCDFVNYSVNAKVDDRISFLREAVEAPLNSDTIGELTVYYLNSETLDDFLEDATLLSLTPERYDNDQLKKLIARFKNG